MQENLGIENALEHAGELYINKYDLMKDRLLSVEYEHWAAGFPEGNNHGRGHITRVLGNLDHLLGPNPLAHLDAYELFLAMMAILYHDIGLLRQRKGHEEISKSLLEGGVNDAYIIHPIDKEIIAAAVVSHSSSKNIDEECSRFSSEEIVGNHKARPRVVAALVRLADELDEDHRRADAILQQRLNLPPESSFFWLFCQRIRGVRPNLIAKRIDFNFAPDLEDTLRCGLVPGGESRHFIAFCAEKFEKINRERVKVNEFLPPELQYEGIHIDVKPLRRHATWKSPRTFVFNDNTTALMFIQSFPELLDEPAKDEMREILELMKQKDLTSAEGRLDRLASAVRDLPVETQMRVVYNQACLHSMRAATLIDKSPECERSLDVAVNSLLRWFERGQAGAFGASGRTADAEVHRMSSDRDLSFVLRKRRDQVRKGIPKAMWPTPSGGGGCVPLGTLIETPSGTCRVELLRPGDEVISLRLGAPNERVRVKVRAIITARSTRCVHLRQDWLVTGGQPVRTATGWVAAAAIRIGDRVMNGNGDFVAIKNLRIVEDYFEVFDLAIDDPCHNYVANGLLCHNKWK